MSTVIEFDRAIRHQWPIDCTGIVTDTYSDFSTERSSLLPTDWSAVSLGSLDLSLQAVAVSPSNLTLDAGYEGSGALLCNRQALMGLLFSFYLSGVLAILNSNCELTIWGPSQNRVTGEWTTVGRRPRSATNSDID